jgi:predicted regulator of Ras-like GTPase activity (Roadblock/LC7/MglB family)
MREVLQRLNAVGGIRGSLMVSPDGLPIALDLPGFDVETFAGLGAHMGRMFAEWAREMGMDGIALGMMETENARLLIAPTAWGFLVAVAEKRCPLGEARLQMRSAAERLNEICAGLASALQEEQARGDDHEEM